MVSLTSKNLDNLRDLWTGCEIPGSVPYAECSFDCAAACRKFGATISPDFESMIRSYCNWWAQDRNQILLYRYDKRRQHLHVFAHLRLAALRPPKTLKLSTAHTGALLRHTFNNPTYRLTKKQLRQLMANKFRNIPLHVRYAVFARDGYTCRSQKT